MTAILTSPAPRPHTQLQVISFGTNEVLVRRTDSDGGAHLTVYPLVRIR